MKSDRAPIGQSQSIFTIFILPCEFGLAHYVRSMLLLGVLSDVHSVFSKMLSHIRQCFCLQDYIFYAF